MSCEVDETEYTSLVASQMLYRWIQKAYVLFDDYDRRSLERFQLNTSQYRTLLLFENEEGKRLTTISDRLLLSKSTITRVIDELEDRGWVERVPDPEDRRAQRVVLTAEGRRKRLKICRAHQQALEDVFQRFSDRQQEDLDSLMQNLCQSLRLSISTIDPIESEP